jgi:uncharacterized membrane protein YgcG
MPSSECLRTNSSQAEILAHCLDAIVTGEATLESCVAQYPEFETLHELLSASLAIQAIPRATLRAPAKADIRERMLAKQRAMHTIQAPPARAPHKMPSIAWSWWRHAVGAIATVLVVMFSGAVLIRASESAVPGDTLYGLKRRIEQIELSFAERQMWPDLVYRNAQLRLTELSILTARHQPLTTAILEDVTHGVRFGVAVQPDVAKRTQLLTQTQQVLERATAEALLDPTLKASALKMLPTVDVTATVDFIPTRTPVAATVAPSATAPLNPSPTPTFTATPLNSPTNTQTLTNTPMPTATETAPPTGTETLVEEPTAQQPLTPTKTTVRRTNSPGASSQRPTQRPRPNQRQTPTQRNPDAGGNPNGAPQNNGGNGNNGNGNGNNGNGNGGGNGNNGNGGGKGK